MRRALQVARWEFVGTLANRQFIVFTTFIPLLMLGFGFVFSLIGTSGVRESLAGLDPDQLRQQFEQSAASGQEPIISIFVAVFLAFIFLFVVLFSGTFVLQNIVREKQNRAIELLLAAVSPRQLIAGKIVAFGGIGLVQALIWVLVGLALFVVVGPYLGVPVWPLLSLAAAFMPWAKVALFLVFFVLGYLFIASLSAGMGSTMNDVFSGQQLQGLIVTFPVMLPLLVATVLLQDVMGTLARVLSVIPPTIPGTMMLRVAIADLPWWEVALSLAVLAGSTLLMMRLAGKIFEVGMLMYGKTANMSEIWRWMRG